MSEAFDFELLRERNLERCALWHPHGGVMSWDLNRWAVALAGEVDELCDEVVARNHCRNENSDRRIAGELADVVIYLDLLAARAGMPAFPSKYFADLVAKAFPGELFCPERSALQVSAAVGRMCDIIKKINRSDDGITGNRVSDDTLRETLEVQAQRALFNCLKIGQYTEFSKISFAEAVAGKFNAVSERNGFDVFLPMPLRPRDACQQVEIVVERVKTAPIKGAQ